MAKLNLPLWWFIAMAVLFVFWIKEAVMAIKLLKAATARWFDGCRHIVARKGPQGQISVMFE